MSVANFQLKKRYYSTPLKFVLSDTYFMVLYDHKIYMWMNIGWLGWINCWWETAKGVTMGDWATDNFPNVSISFSAQAQASMANRLAFSAWYEVQLCLASLCRYVSLLNNFAICILSPITFHVMSIRRWEGWWPGKLSHVASRYHKSWFSVVKFWWTWYEPLDAAKAGCFLTWSATWHVSGDGHSCFPGSNKAGIITHNAAVPAATEHSWPGRATSFKSDFAASTSSISAAAIPSKHLREHNPSAGSVWVPQTAAPTQPVIQWAEAPAASPATTARITAAAAITVSASPSTSTNATTEHDQLPVCI